jgi:hypothetical protein
MHRRILGETAFQLGFGCVQLTVHPRQAEAVAILEYAFSLGITHFDVARSYGFGRAEGILGKFLRGRRDQVTVATKFGLQPPSGLAGNGRLITAAKRLLTPIPGLMRRAKRLGAAMGKAGVFAPEAAIRSLETSLRELSTDYLDLLLLHEATLANAAGEPLLEALEKQVAKERFDISAWRLIFASSRKTTVRCLRGTKWSSSMTMHGAGICRSWPVASGACLSPIAYLRRRRSCETRPKHILISRQNTRGGSTLICEILPRLHLCFFTTRCEVMLMALSSFQAPIRPTSKPM